MEACFTHAKDGDNVNEELEDCILKVTNTILIDPSKYLTLDFMSYLMLKLIDTNRTMHVETILLDPRISVTLYPDLWTIYIERYCKTGNYQEPIQLIDKLMTKTISDIYVTLYNQVMEKFVLYKGRA